MNLSKNFNAEAIINAAEKIKICASYIGLAGLFYQAAAPAFDLPQSNTALCAATVGLSTVILNDMIRKARETFLPRPEHSA